MSALGKFSKVRVLNNGTPVGAEQEPTESKTRAISVGVLTISDRCSHGIKEDFSGPNLQKIIQEHKGFRSVIKAFKIVPDESDQIEDTLIQWSDSLGLDLIVSTGGTGLGPRDVTPEATAAVIDREAPGFSIAIISASLRVTKDAMVTRLKSGLRGKTIIINLPGSKKASDECLRVVLPAIPHAIECLKDDERVCDCTIEDIDAIKASQNYSVVVTNELEAFRRKMNDPPDAPSPGPPENPTGGHHHHQVHHATIQALGEEILEDDLALDDIDVESLLSGNNQSNLTGGVSEDSGVVSTSGDDVSTDGQENSGSIDFPAISVNQAFDVVLQKTSVLDSEELIITEAFGRTLAEDVKAVSESSDLIAEIKGYAITGSILQGEIRVVKIGDKVGRFEAGQVTTGSVLPPGTNTVIPVDNTKLLDGNKIQILKSVVSGQGAKPRKGDGEVILEKGIELGPSEIGKLASAGVDNVKTYRNPVVAVLSIGERATEQVNHVTLQSSFRQHSVIPKDCGIISPDFNKLKIAISEAYRQADVIICASESPKSRELARTVMSKTLNAATHFGNVAMKPWETSYFATTNQNKNPKVFFVLPECPTAGILSTIFVVPVLRKMSGAAEPGHTILKALLPNEITLKDLPQYQQCKVSWLPGKSLPLVESVGQISSSTPSVSDAKALLLLPASSEERTEIKRGDTADILLITSI